MPLPTPHKDPSGEKESKKQFIARCMKDKNVQNDFKTQEQKLAVCYSRYKEKKSKASYVVQAGNDEFLFFDGEEPTEQ